MSEPSGDGANEPLSGPPPDTSFSVDPLPPAGPRGWVATAWIAILLTASAFVALQYLGKRAEEKAPSSEPGNYALLELQLRYCVGLQAAGNVKGDKLDPVIKQVNNFNTGRVSQRLRAITVIGEIAGPQAALKELNDLRELIKEHQHEPPEADVRLLDILIKVYTDYADGRLNAPTATPDERRDVARQLGWFGELAMAPAGGPADSGRPKVIADAERTFFVLTVAAIGVVVVFTLGFIILFFFIVAWLRGAKVSRLGPPRPHSGVYAESFALWFITYGGMLFIGSPRWSSLPIDPAIWPLVAAGVSVLISLVWPVLRGVGWRQSRTDIGLTLGEQPLLEPTMGFVCYLMSLPLLLVGGATTLALMLTFGGAPAAVGDPDPFRPAPNLAHPIIQQILNGSVADWLPTILLASVVAPVMEEIVFRGMLYRHLRDATRGWKIGFVFSVLAVSVVFAIVHPQGLLATPALASLACGFALAREWRGTLIPGFIAHILQNSLVLTIVVMGLMR